MTKSLRVRFDGKVLVPQEKVDLPTDRELQVEVSDKAAAGEGALSEFVDWVKTLAAIDRGKTPTDGAAQHDHYLYGHQKRK
jgi:hypothetical protein